MPSTVETKCYLTEKIRITGRLLLAVLVRRFFEIVTKTNTGPRST